MHLRLFLLLFLFSSTSAGAEVYRWVDENGKVHYGDKKTVERNSIKNQQAVNLSEGSTSRPLLQRSREDIKKTFDRYKDTIDRIYQRALRNNPSLEGMFEVSVTIEPSGQISAISVLNSELDNEELEQFLLRYMRRINFGEDLVDAQTITQKFQFFPQ